MKVYFFVLGSGNSTTSYSNRMFAKGLMQKGYSVEIVETLQDKYSILEKVNSGIIFFQKTIQCPAHISKAFKHLKGKVFLVHIDDDFQDMKNAEHIHTLDSTDLILVGTAQHKEALKHYTSTPVETISCLLDIENYPFSDPIHKNNMPLIISWQQSCADAYTKDLLSIASPLSALFQKYNFQLDLYGWHLGKDYPDRSNSVREALPFANFIEYQPMTKYLTHIIPRLSQSDIFIMPYIDIPERWGKSGFSLKRIMLLGIPIAATATLHHQDLIKHQFNGLLAVSLDEWYSNIEKLILDVNLRSRLAQNARNKMDSEYHFDQVMDNFISNVKKHCKYF